MRIGIDGGCWNNRRGYGRYARELLEAVSRADGQNRYTIFLDSPAAFPIPAAFEQVRVETSANVAESASADSRLSTLCFFHRFIPTSRC